MKHLAKFLLVVLFPVSILTMIGVISLFVHLITSVEFYTVSEHPVTWLASFIVVVIAYLNSYPEEYNSSENIEDNLV